MSFVRKLASLYFVSICFAGVLLADPKHEALVPGLIIDRIPVDLTNINSLDYGHDGRLFAAAYNGKIYALSDTDGDGIEDEAKVYWDKPGDLLTPVGIVAAKEGVYLAVRGKIALIKDTNGDGVGDLSEIVTSDWGKETHNSDRRNDASGITLDREGNLYFSLGCMSYNKAWMLDRKGKSHYRKDDERGAILRVSPDRKKREIFATGLRFAIGLEFNKHGDLFATDQEGDTWFPGGNPRDELLHILPGRHYGFPFRHKKYLPDSVDEPEVVGYAPQHQSTCGFRFNEVKPNRQPFGPAHWEGDAFVTGFSRGKLWRTPLAKTRAGYVGKQIQIAAFESLPTDVAISPTGDLVVTCHGGSPDWGSGPAAKGHLYKLRYKQGIPQPVLSWSSDPFETKVAFDRPIDLKSYKNAEIEVGEFVWEGNRQEWILPGYEVVKAEKRAARLPLEVRQLSLSEDGRTLSILTAPQPWRARYGITLIPGEGGESIQLSHDLSGVEAEWTRQGDTQSSWKGWLPHLDFNVIRSLTRQSSEHEKLLVMCREPGSLKMRSLLKIPGEKVSLQIEGNTEFKIECRGVEVHSHGESDIHKLTIGLRGDRSTNPDGSRGERIEVLPTEEVRFSVELATGKDDLSFDISYRADFDPHERPLRLEHITVPWAPVVTPSNSESPNENWVATTLKGDPEKGRELFYSSETNCSLCHTFAGQGGKVGPDLTVSFARGAEAVLHDITKPSASINPEFVSYAISTRSGKTYSGLFLSADRKAITLVDAASKSHTIQRDDIAEITSLPVSLMPAGYEHLGKEKLDHLVAFLCQKTKAESETTGYILREYWLGLPKSGSLEALRGMSSFPDKPSGRDLLKNFEGPVNWKELYGTRIRGYLHPLQTGNYTFYIAADDYAEVWLSTSDSSKKKSKILSLEGWTPSRDWERYPSHQSKPVHLKAGQRYFIEVLHAEGSVDDCVAVGWKLPDGSMERPIPGKRLSPFENALEK